MIVLCWSSSAQTRERAFASLGVNLLLCLLVTGQFLTVVRKPFTVVAVRMPLVVCSAIVGGRHDRPRRRLP